MDKQELRRGIAEALGYTFETIGGIHIVTAPYGMTMQLDVDDDPISAVPDWPGDTAAALALCEQIALPHGLRVMITYYEDLEPDDPIRVCVDLVETRSLFVPDSIRDRVEYLTWFPIHSGEGTDVAHAASNAALAALQARAVRDE